MLSEGDINKLKEVAMGNGNTHFSDLSRVLRAAYVAMVLAAKGKGGRVRSEVALLLPYLTAQEVISVVEGEKGLVNKQFISFPTGDQRTYLVHLPDELRPLLPVIRKNHTAATTKNRRRHRVK